MLRHLTLYFLLFTSVLSGQEEAASHLANEVCQCMESITTQRPRGFARACLDQVARNNRALAEEILERPLGGDYPRDMADLLGHLNAYLAADCPFLKTLQSKPQVSEYRWSDRKASPKAGGKRQFDKTPPADNAGNTWAEQPTPQLFEGNVISVNKDGIELSDGVGETLRLQISRRLRSQYAPEVGDMLSVLFRSEWSLKKNEIQHILLEVL